MKTEEQYESEHRIIFYAIVLVFDLMKQRILITDKQGQISKIAHF